MQQALEAAFVLASFAAAWSDVRTRRIPNALSFGLIASAIIAHLVSGGLSQACVSLVLALATIILGTFVYERGWLAGGDIKLIAGGVAVFSVASTIDFLLLTCMAGGMLAILAATRQRRLFGTLRAVTMSLTVPGMPLTANANHGSLPYGLAICAGALLTTLSHNTGLRLPL